MVKPLFKSIRVTNSLWSACWRTRLNLKITIKWLQILLCLFLSLCLSYVLKEVVRGKWQRRSQDWLWNQDRDQNIRDQDDDYIKMVLRLVSRPRLVLQTYTLVGVLTKKVFEQSGSIFYGVRYNLHIILGRNTYKKFQNVLTMLRGNKYVIIVILFNYCYIIFKITNPGKI